MIKILSFLPFTFFADSKEENLYYIISFGLLFDFFLYHFFFLNTFFFLILYIVNKKFRKSKNYFIFLFKNILNLIIGFIFYALYTNSFFSFDFFFKCLLLNLLVATIFYRFHKKSLEINLF